MSYRNPEIGSPKPDGQRSLGTADQVFIREIEGGIRLYDLTKQGGIDHFRTKLISSHGSAHIIVHPFSENFRRDYVSAEGVARLDTYNQQLQREVEIHQEEGVPTVLFERLTSENELPQTLTSLGVTGREIFTVITFERSPSPQSGLSLIELTKRLRIAGLTNVIVNGTRFYENPHIGGIPEAMQPTEYGGCVGATILSLRESGISANPGKATLDLI